MCGVMPWCGMVRQGWSAGAGRGYQTSPRVRPSRGTTRIPSGTPNMCSQACEITLDQRPPPRSSSMIRRLRIRGDSRHSGKDAACDHRAVSEPPGGPSTGEQDVTLLVEREAADVAQYVVVQVGHRRVQLELRQTVPDLRRRQ
jgi:hypothetical protein